MNAIKIEMVIKERKDIEKVVGEIKKKYNPKLIVYYKTAFFKK